MEARKIDKTGLVISSVILFFMVCGMIFTVNNSVMKVEKQIVELKEKIKSDSTQRNSPTEKQIVEVLIKYNEAYMEYGKGRKSSTMYDYTDFLKRKPIPKLYD